jgi:thiamine-monophosphate kinase
MDEFELIRQFFSHSALDHNVRLGVGDDGAVLVPEPGRDIIAVVDTVVDSVHFPSDLDAADIGYRVMAVNLSDIAAMGGRPRWATLAITLASANATWLKQFSAGLFAAAEEFGVALVGGDTTRGQQLVISVQVLGDVPAKRAITRGGARTGDDIYVSGTLGDAAAGLRLLQQGGKDGPARLLNRFRRPVARVGLGQALVGLATAAIDVSDGLIGDLGKLLEASASAAIIEISNVPLSTELQAAFGDKQALQIALTGGDDYELCFTADPCNAETLQQLATSQDLLLTKIGVIGSGKGLQCLREGQPVEIADPGYRHFSEPTE